MKTHIRMIIASAIVIALALTAVSGITYSWFSDTQTTEINVSTANMGITVKTGEPTNTNSLVTTSIDSDSVGISNLCANTDISVPYEINYFSTIDVVARVMAVAAITSGDTLSDDFKNVTISVGSMSSTLYDIINNTTGDDHRGVTLLPWTYKTAGGAADSPITLVDDAELRISVNSDFETKGVTITIMIASEIYQGNYVYTFYTHIYPSSAKFNETDEGRILAFNNMAYEIPDNGLVNFDKVRYTFAPQTFTNVLLDFTKCTDYKYFAMIFKKSESGSVTIEIIPLIAVVPTDGETYYKEATITEEGDVTISLNYNKSLEGLTMKDSADGEGSTTDIILNRSTDDGSFVIINVPISETRILVSDNID